MEQCNICGEYFKLVDLTCLCDKCFEENSLDIAAEAKKCHIKSKMKWRKRKENNKVVHSHKGPCGNIVCNNTFEIVNGHTFSGSGDEAFGGASVWPTVRIQIPFFATDTKSPDKFIKDFKVFLEQWLIDNEKLDKRFLK